MPRATHGFAFGILFVVAGWGAAVWLSRAAAPTAPAPAGTRAATAAAASHHEVGEGGEGGERAAEEAASAAGDGQRPLWGIYERLLKRARYVDLTHTVTPSIPVWAGFGRSTFGPAADPKTGRAFTYARERYIAICPPGWKYGVAIGEVPEAPLALQARPLHWDAKAGMRIR